MKLGIRSQLTHIFANSIHVLKNEHLENIENKSTNNTI